MSSLPPPWDSIAPVAIPFVLGIAIALGIAAFVRRRREGYARYCRARGFGYEMDGGSADSLPPVVALLDPKREGQWFTRISGHWNGVPFTAIDYHWGDAPSGRATTVAAMIWDLPEAAHVPTFRLDPEGAWDRLKQRFGAPDIDFPDDAEFSGAYRLQGDDEAAVRAWFTPAIRQPLATARGQHVASDGRHLMWWTAPGLSPQPLPRGAALGRFFGQGDAIRRLFWR